MTTRAIAPNVVRKVDDEKRIITFVASTFDLDSHSTRIDPNGWVLERFRKNPVILLNHDAYGFSQSGGLPVGRGIDPRVQDGKLMIDVQFPSEDTDPFAHRVYKLTRDGFLGTGSVGFNPLRSEVIQEDGEDVRVYRQQELLEFSIVSIPSNENAVAQRGVEMGKSREEIEQARKELEQVETAIRAMPRETEDQRTHREYFERKKPANKVATSFLKKLYQARGEEIPQDEVEAWQKAEELIEAKPEEAQEETPPESTPPEQAAPAPAPAAPVQLTYHQILEAKRLFEESLVETAVKALRRGVPERDVDHLIDRAGESFARTVVASVITTR